MENMDESADAEKSGPETNEARPDTAFNDLSSRTSYFRKKLIDEFQILDNINNHGTAVLRPQYGSRAMDNEDTRSKILYEAPNQLIKFSLERTPVVEENTHMDKRLLKVKNQNSVPFATWAHWVVESLMWKKIMFATILVNCVNIWIIAEYEDRKHTHYEMLIVMDLVDKICIIMFSLEIMLKWFDDFRHYWFYFENLMDFIITIMSLVPVILEEQFKIENESSQGIATMATALRTVRIMRIVGLIFRYGPLRIIVLTVIQAFKSMAWILILILLMMYIFSVIFMTLFEKYTLSKVEGLLYQHAFRNMWNAIITCFQLLTFDQWFNIVNDLAKELGTIYLPGVFILTWVILGGFIFRNVFVGVMVNNFHVMSVMMQRQKTELALSEKRELLKQRLNEELSRDHAEQQEIISITSSLPKYEETQEEDVKQNVMGQAVESLHDVSIENLTNHLDEFVIKAQNAAGEWDLLVADNFLALHGDLQDTSWPKDILFRYLQKLESIQENMKEYKELQSLATMAILNLHEP